MENKKDLLKTLSRYQGIIYDFDGTLAIMDVNWGEMKKALTDFMFAEIWDHIEFTPLDEVLWSMRSNFGEVLFWKLLDIISDWELASHITVCSEDLINFISHNSKKQAVFTMNTHRAIMKFLRDIFPLRIPFDSIISKNNCEAPKPSDIDIHKIIHSWWMNKAHVAYIWNSHKDRVSWEMAGIDTFII